MQNDHPLRKMEPVKARRSGEKARMYCTYKTDWAWLVLYEMEVVVNRANRKIAQGDPIDNLRTDGISVSDPLLEYLTMYIFYFFMLARAPHL